MPPKKVVPIPGGGWMIKEEKRHMPETEYDECIRQQLVTWIARLDYQLKSAVVDSPRRGRHVLVFEPEDKSHLFEVRLYPTTDPPRPVAAAAFKSPHYVTTLFNSGYRVVRMIISEPKTGCLIEIGISQVAGFRATADIQRCLIDTVHPYTGRLKILAEMLTQRMNDAFAFRREEMLR